MVVTITTCMPYIFHYLIRTPNEITLEHEDDENDVDTNRGEISGTQAGSVYSHVTNVEELEMILGAYFVQIGGTLNKLFAVCRNVLCISICIFVKSQ